VEVATYHGKFLVRFRDRQGTTTRRSFTDPNDAMTHFWKCADQLKGDNHVPTR
jgi:hypothetical protein